ncbi:MAG: hypothetical protein DRI69_02845 [Bacteroidetes bacterium]|nr:MAG: hypothetical protein DRI69_02845 [Bacteroidota bacterium]
MLFYSTIDPTTLQLLKDLQGVEYLKENKKLASIQDIAAMQLAAITGRGFKKDFIDLYFILEQFSLAQIFDFYEKKYQDGSKFLAHKSLIYFEDAEIEPMPKMLKPISWVEIKARIIAEVTRHFH